MIARSGKPVAKLVLYRKHEGPRRPGLWRGLVRLAPDFDETPAEIVAAFDGEAS